MGLAIQRKFQKAYNTPLKKYMGGRISKSISIHAWMEGGKGRARRGSYNYNYKETRHLNAGTAALSNTRGAFPVNTASSTLGELKDLGGRTAARRIHTHVYAAVLPPLHPLGGALGGGHRGALGGRRRGARRAD